MLNQSLDFWNPLPVFMGYDPKRMTEFQSQLRQMNQLALSFADGNRMQAYADTVPRHAQHHRRRIGRRHHRLRSFYNLLPLRPNARKVFPVANPMVFLQVFNIFGISELRRPNFSS